MQSENDKFLYDGKFVANEKALGTWMTVDVVESIDEFTPGTQKKAGGGRFRTMIFNDEGQTGSVMWLWSGDMLMDLERYQALKMTVKKIGGNDYLFIEAGGFSPRNPVGWQSPWCVMKRK